MSEQVKEKSESKAKHLGVLISAAFLMATSAIGPNFMTQVTHFTETFKADFAFIILAVCILDIITQLNVWTILGVTKLRGQDLSNKVLPGLGYFIAALVALGGFAFNLGNIGGVGMSLHTLFGINERYAILIGGAIALAICLAKNAQTMIDWIAKVCGGIVILLMAYVVFGTHPPVGEALAHAVAPTALPPLVLPLITVLGGSAGGYVPFAGAHRLLDAGISGKENLGQIRKSVFTGVGVTTVVRILLFLATLGVVVAGKSLDPTNPAASVFQFGAGEIGLKLFGICLFAVAITSVLGASYTSVTFLKTFHPFIAEHAGMFQAAFIIASSVVCFMFGKPAALMVFVAGVNGLILPVTLVVTLIASLRKDIVGDYKHPRILIVLGFVVVITMGFFGIKNLGPIIHLVTG